MKHVFFVLCTLLYVTAASCTQVIEATAAPSDETPAAESQEPLNPVGHDQITSITEIYEELISLLNLIIAYGEQEHLNHTDLIFLKQLRRNIAHQLTSMLPLKAERQHSA